MVHGLEKFREYFADHIEEYVFIGGTACALLMEELGGVFRATRDLDTVLVIEEITPKFGERFWSFINDGGYTHQQRDGKNQFYRFSHPQDDDFPSMIELFSRKPDEMILRTENGLTPLPLTDEVVSLSAILLDDKYYQLLLSGKQAVNGFSVLGIEYVMVFKMKAWLDLSQRRKQGESIDSKNIRKHRNDVFRLMQFVNPASQITLDSDIHIDVSLFIAKMVDAEINLSSLGIRRIKKSEILGRMQNLFQVAE